MSREIKFRAWDKVSKNFLDMSDACYYLLPHGKLVQITCNERKPDTHIELDAVVQLYTGIKDCNSKEIYEGDIVKFDDGEIAEVVFFCGAFMPKLKKGQCVGIDYDAKPIWQDGEVIGNIYENKELLND